MAPFPLGLQLAQSIGVGGALWLSGTIASVSTITMPALLQAQGEQIITVTTLAQQWSCLYATGKARAPPIAVTVAASFLYMAWSVRAGTHFFKNARVSRSALYSVAACFVVGIVPFTLVMMASTNNALLGLPVAPLADSSVLELMEKWTSLNRARSCLPLIGGVCGIVASLL
ncbi:hypothetical protein N7495_006665 [Penicillium taxi]|uniref:uncharacterized protein n=1 Tax=Penicillium taxi TaxID=168475 RepID=UPI002545BC8A|nr:uncharacterized protein N7495_006665 [Penicillium taxi]KAJ5894974.1 hypothetical protein N7495_006665 [Penicillium taxi]